MNTLTNVVAKVAIDSPATLVALFSASERRDIAFTLRGVGFVVAAQALEDTLTETPVPAAQTKQLADLAPGRRFTRHASGSPWMVTTMENDSGTQTLCVNLIDGRTEWLSNGERVVPLAG